MTLLGPSAGLPLIACVFETQGRKAVLFAELARTELEHARGLAFRPWIAPSAAMLFVFDEPAPLRFWMRDTFIPLDMIFLDGAGVVVAVEESAPPHSLEPRGPDEPAQFVVEARAGFARAHGVTVGTRVRFVPLSVGE